MKKAVLVVLAMSLTVGAAVVSYGKEKATAKEAETMVKAAIVYMKSNGRAKTIAEINNPTGKFINKDLYLSVSDLSGKCLAHGQNIKLVGKDLSELKDSDGKSFYKERIEIAKTKGKGWQDYKFTNPVTKMIEAKTTYFEKHEDLIIAGGVYKQ